MTILIVDDDHDTVATLAMLLRRAGCYVIECEKGKEAMALIEQHKPTHVLLDLAMPGMDGFAIADELSHNPDLRPQKLIALSGYGDERMRERTSEAGFDCHLLKPVEFSELLAAMQRSARLVTTS
jgi:CheY-like chemotaxis protein